MNSLTRPSIVAVLACWLVAACHSTSDQIPCRVDSDCDQNTSYCGGTVTYCGGNYLAQTRPSFCVPAEVTYGDPCKTDYDCLSPAEYCAAGTCTYTSCLQTGSAVTYQCPSSCSLGRRKTSGMPFSTACEEGCVCDVCPSLNDAGELNASDAAISGG